MSSGYKIFAAILYSSDEMLYKSIAELKKTFGEVDFETKEYDFGKFTKYYEREMGKNLRKKFVFFKEFSNINMADAKKMTMGIEKRFSVDGKRKVNIDPGYLNENEMGMPTTKYLKFKTLLKEGIYNQIIYRFDDGIKEAEGAFPDFRSDEVKSIFAKVFISLKNK
ncbi:MAG TPA: DUF4416 family protein [Candidatus Nanoarchaeia archaeon]|nr:DUF4416 family protein [Candidatus Nanoarchaeia archaeon]